MLEMSVAQQKAETLAHLDHQLAASLLLRSRHEVLAAAAAVAFSTHSSSADFLSPPFP